MQNKARNKTLKTSKLFASCALALAFTMPAIAEKNSIASNKDNRIKTVYFAEADVVVVHGHYGYTTAIEFGEDEIIETVSIGDSVAWSVAMTGQDNLLFVKPLEPNADTNLTVISNKRIYTFSLIAKKARSKKDADITFRLKFKYPQEESDRLVAKFREKNRLEGLNLSEEITPENWNFNYSFAGSLALRPLRTFDDGQFTYFKFQKLENVPSIFKVDETGRETLINYQVKGEYIVVERIAQQFTLRDGEHRATCIFNEAYPEPEFDSASPKVAYQHAIVEDGDVKNAEIVEKDELVGGPKGKAPKS